MCYKLHFSLTSTQLHKHQTCFSFIPYVSEWCHHLLDKPLICFYMISFLLLSRLTFHLSVSVCASFQQYQTTYTDIVASTFAYTTPTSFPSFSNSSINPTGNVPWPPPQLSKATLFSFPHASLFRCHRTFFPPYISLQISYILTSLSQISL